MTVNDGQKKEVWHPDFFASNGKAGQYTLFFSLLGGLSKVVYFFIILSDVDIGNTFICFLGVQYECPSFDNLDKQCAHSCMY